MSGRVEILNVTQIPVTPLPHPPPPIKLSCFDSIWIGFPPTQRLLLYTTADTNLPFPSLLQILKSSLSSTLLHFLPLAGKLTFLPSTGDVEIDCSSPSVTFVEAESDLDIHRLAADEVHDAESFVRLVPAIDIRELPFPVFAVQVTKFCGGGVAIGYSVHHTAADGKAMWQFVEAWTVACKAEVGGCLPPERRPPSYDRALIRHPRGEEIARDLLRSSSPDLPYTAAPGLKLMSRRLQLTQRTFVLDAASIHCLKQRATQRTNSTAESYPPSTFLALSAHALTCYARSKSLEPDQDAILAFLGDCRTRLDPPIQDGYFGNCIKLVYVPILVGDLIGDDGLPRACAETSKAIRECLEDPLRDCENWIADFKKQPLSSVSNVSASPRFRVYETDFGWGRPDRVELVSMNHDGEIVLVGGKDEGTVQVSVALNRNQMETFAEAFVGGLSG